MKNVALIQTVDGVISIEKLEGDYLFVRVEGSGISAEQKIFIHSDLDELKSLFVFMNDNWQGWTGSRQFKSVEKDFSLVVNHDGKSNVLISVEMKDVLESDRTWTVKLATKIEISQVDAIAHSIKNL